MVKIDCDRRSPGNLPLTGKGGAQKVKPGQKGSFGQELLEKEEEACWLRMKEILDEIDRVADRLSANLNLQDLVKYKRLVQGFLKEATSRLYIINRESRFTRRGARSILVSVEKVDQEVQALIEQFAGRTREPLEILETLDKIRGMLVDMLA